MQDEAVTPVVGTVMVLAITMLGIAAIMLWGAPTLQSIQDRNTVLAMEGEFLEVRSGTLALMIDKASRNPEINLQEGELEIGPGTRMLIADEGPDENCDLVITGWDAGATTFTVAKQAGGCPLSSAPADCDDGPPGGGSHCIEVNSVIGNNIDTQDVTISGSGPYTITLPGGEDITDGDWNIRIENNAGDPVGQGWILATDRLSWTHSSSVGTYKLFLEGGAIFEERDGRTFLVKPPAVQEDVFATGDLFIRVPAYIGEYRSVSQGLTPNVFIGQVGNNHLRASVADTTGVRFSFAGDLASAWCQTLLIRTVNLDDATYVEPTTDSCDDTLATVLYAPNTQTDDVPFELIHARITTRLNT